jgi:hypothetical protein
MNKKANKLYTTVALALTCFIQPLAVITNPVTAAAEIQIAGNLTGGDGSYKRDVLVNIRYWRVVNPNGTKLIINGAETNQVLPAGTVFEALSDARGRVVWETQPLSRNKLITPVVYGIPQGARVEANVSEIAPASGSVVTPIPLPVPIPSDDFAGDNGIYKRDELVNIRYWRVINPNGTKLIINGAETNQVLPAGIVFEAASDAKGRTIWQNESVLTRSKLITPIGYGLPSGAKVRAKISEIVPANPPQYPPYPGYYPPAPNYPPIPYPTYPGYYPPAPYPR